MMLYFSLLKVPFSSSQSPCFVPFKFPFLPPKSPVPLLFHSSSVLSVLFPPLKVLSLPPPIPVPILSKSSPLLPDSRFHPLRPLPSSFVLSLPPPPSQRKQRNDTKPSRRSWLWSVPKLNIPLSFRVRPQPAVARLAHLKAVVSVRQLLPGLGANVMIHSNVKQAVIARPAADE